LIEFSRQTNQGDQFSVDLAARFVEEYRDGNREVDTPGEGWRRHVVLGAKVLADFAHHGRIERAFTDIEHIHLLPAMAKVLRDDEQYGTDRLQLRPTSLRKRTRELTIFLDFLKTRGRTLDHIQALDLSEFLSSRDHLQRNTVSRMVSDVRSFLRFLTMRGILQPDLGGALPTIRGPRDATIPSVWDRELLVRLLGAIDRSSAKGKRDDAMRLLACRLGLRVGDIRALKLDDLHWDDSRIEITQSKTATPLSLPLTDEVGEAVIDYLRAGRPTTAHREIFLKLTPPFDPFVRGNLYHIVTDWRRLAGITFRTPHTRGIHSLRHTLATRLLQQGTPFHTIANILGHTSVESTRIYAKADVEALRSVALDPEEVHHAG
jgi:site-specific recombinase XerD